MTIWRTVIAVLSMFLIICSSALAWDGRWEALAQANYLGQFKDIDVGYTSGGARYIFAADGDLNGHIWLTVNDGQNWLQKHSVTNHRFSRTAVQHADFRYGWALVPSEDRFSDAAAGPYRTENWGNEWNLRPGDLHELDESKLLYSLAVDQSSLNLQTAFVGGDGVGQSGRHLFKTTNGGASWAQITNGIPEDPQLGNGIVTDIVIYPPNTQIMYLALDCGGGSNNGIYKSTDGGESWLKTGSCFFYPQALAIDPNNSAVLVASSWRVTLWHVDSWVWRSTDSGVNWEAIYSDDTNGGYYYAFCHSLAYASDGYVYMAFANENDPSLQQFVGRWSSINGFEFLPTPPNDPAGDKKAWSVAIDPLYSSYVYAGTEHTFYRSTNNGTSFEPRVSNIYNILGANGVNANLPNIEFISNQPPFGSIYRSSDYGQNWAVRKSEGIVNSTFIHSDPGQPGLCFAGTTADYGLSKIYRSLDEGETWAIIPGLPTGVQGTANCLTIDPGSNWVYWGISGSTSRGYYRSPDNGNTWLRYSYYPPSDPNPLDIAIHPTQPATIVVADGTNGLYRSLDRGEDGFTAINNGISPVGANKIAYCPGQPDMALTATPQGIYKSGNMDQPSPLWLASNYGGYVGAIIDMEFHPTENSIVCFGVSDLGLGRFFISADTARSWIELNAGLNMNVPNDISVDIANPDTFYAATNDGIYKLKNPVKSGLITGTEVWGPGMVIVNGDVTIPLGVTLSIAPGTTIKTVYDFDKNQSGSDINKSEIIVYGTLSAIGAQNNPIVFESSKPTGPGAGQWYGLYVGYGGQISLTYCNVKHAAYGIYAYKPNSLNVDNCLFEKNTTAGIYYSGKADASDPLIRYSRIQDCGTYGVFCGNRSITLDTDTLINNLYGVNFTHDGNLTVRNCRMYFTTPATTYYGIWASKNTSGFHPIIEGDSIAGFAQGGI